MIEYCKENLLELKKLANQLSAEQYCFSSQFLSGSTIGQHIRHVLEFYSCLLNTAETGRLNYDERERKTELEENPDCAVFTIDCICQDLDQLEMDSTLSIQANYSVVADLPLNIESRALRELSYCLEHSIHHQAMIRVCLKEQQLEKLVSPNFGVAPSTIRFKKECVQ